MPEHTIILKLVDHTGGLQLEPLHRRLDRLEAILDDHDDSLRAVFDRLADTERLITRLENTHDSLAHRVRLELDRHAAHLATLPSPKPPQA